MAKRLNQGIKNKTSHSKKTKKRVVAKFAAKKARQAAHKRKST